MWNYEEFIAKAQLYFSRAEENPRMDDTVALWLLLGLEFLLRAPLANVHPTLLAEPTGDSIMHAAGFPLKPDSGQPKSIPAHTVIKRLGTMIPEFTKDLQTDASLLSGMRNEELHTSSSPLDTDATAWFPQFIRVAEAMCNHLNLDADDLVGKSIMRHGRSLVGEVDKKLEQDVRRRLNDAKAFFARLKPEEISARMTQVSNMRKGLIIPDVKLDTTSNSIKAVEIYRVVVECPACSRIAATLSLDSVRVTNERLEDEEVHQDVLYVAETLSCAVCDLELKSTAELRAAQVKFQYVETRQESLADRYVGWDESDYGND